MESARCKRNRCCKVAWLGCCWLRTASQQPMAAPTLTRCCKLRITVEGETVTRGGLFQLLGGDFAGL